MKKISRFSVCLLGLGAMVQPAGAWAQAQDSADNDGAVISLSLGANYTTGDYGDPEETSVLSVPVTLRYRQGNFNIRVSAPWVRIDGPGSLIDSSSEDSGSGRGRGRGGSNSGSGSGIDIDDDDDPLENGTSSGIGDVTIAATYELELTDSLWLDTTGRIKLPTASASRRLGTGQMDFGLGADLVHEAGPVTVYAGGRRRFIGNNATTTYRDVWGAGAGISTRLGNGASAGMDLDWQQSAVVGNGASTDVTGWISFRLAGPLRMSLFAGTGLSTNSHDFTGGASISARF